MGRDDRVEIGWLLGRSREWSCGGRVWSSSGREKVVYNN